MTTRTAGNILNIAKWLGPVLGAFLWTYTESVFGTFASALVGTIMGCWFWLLLNSEQLRVIGIELGAMIRDVAGEGFSADMIIEIRGLPLGFLAAQIYYIGSEEVFGTLRSRITEKIVTSRFARRLKIVQMTCIHSRTDFPAAQRVLNRQMAEELSRKKKKKG